MKAIGFRAEKDNVNWALVEGTIERPYLLGHGRSQFPSQLSEPQSLCWLRVQVSRILQEHSPDRVAVRVSDTEWVSHTKGRSLEAIL